MHTGVTLVSWVALLLIGFTLVGGPMFLMDWFRKRRLMQVEHQIALTAALDAEVGVFVAPVVTKPLLGPWEIRIAVPYIESTKMAKVLSVVDGVFAGILGMNSSSYQIYLSAKPQVLRGTRASGTILSKARRAANPLAPA